MATIFTKIINGDIPSRMVWEDDTCVAFLDVRPLTPGHCLVIPRTETDQWTDLPVDAASHCMNVGHHLGNAQKVVFEPARIGLMIAGFEVSHAHLHVFPLDAMSNFDFANANTKPDQAELDNQMMDLRQALESAGHKHVSQR